MRAILVDWLIQIHDACEFKDEILYKAIHILDTYLSINNISVSKLQLCGMACLLIACKLDTMNHLSVKKLPYFADNAYTEEELKKMEKEILTSINFNILYPSSNEFYNIFSEICKFNKEQYFLGKYFLDTFLIDYKMIQYSNSHIAISCIYIVMKYFNIDGYSKLFNPKFYLDKNNYSKLIKEIANHICNYLYDLSFSSLNSTKNKYSLEKYCCVAKKICKNL